MKKFEFRMDSALRWRNTQLQMERAKLQGLLAEQQRVIREIADLSAERLATVAAVNAMPQLEASDLRSLAAYQVGADFRAHHLRDQLEKRTQLAEKQHACVMNAELQVKLLDKLKVKKKVEWQLEFEKDLENNAAEAWLASHFGATESSEA